MLEDDFLVLSAYGSRRSVGVSLLVGCNFNVDVNLVFVDGRSLLVLADIAVESFEFRVAAVYALKIGSGRVSCWLVGWLVGSVPLLSETDSFSE